MSRLYGEAEKFSKGIRLIIQDKKKKSAEEWVGGQAPASLTLSKLTPQGARPSSQHIAEQLFSFGIHAPLVSIGRVTSLPSRNDCGISLRFAKPNKHINNNNNSRCLFFSIWGLESPENPVVILKGAEDKMNPIRHLEDISRTQIPEVSTAPRNCRALERNQKSSSTE